LPRNGSDSVPLTSFNLFLTFSETVQAGHGTVMLRSSHSTEVIETCGLHMQVFANHVIIPVRAELHPETVYTFMPTLTCFQNANNETLGVQDHSNYKFTTIRRGSSVFSYDVLGPIGLGPSTLQPLPGAFVHNDANFSLIFSEAVQRGVSNMAIMEKTGGVNKARIFDDNPNISFSNEILGKVFVTPRWLLNSGAEYELTFPAGSLKDLAGNYIDKSVSSLGVSSYHLKVGTSLLGILPFSPPVTSGRNHTVQNASPFFNNSCMVLNSKSLYALARGH